MEKTDEIRAKAEMDARASLEREIEERYEGKLEEELAKMREKYEEDLKKVKETYEYSLQNMIVLFKKQVAEANRKAENLYDGAMRYKGYLESYSRDYGVDVIDVLVREDGLWFLIDRKG